MINTNLKSLTPRREAYKRTITLVSGGYYAPKAFPNGQITVFPWDSNVDVWFQDRMRKPKPEYILWETADKVANLNGASYKQMPFGDILTVLMVARAILTDCTLDYTAVCPQCKHEHHEKIVIPDELVRAGEKAPDFKGIDQITLPESGDVIELRVITVGDEIEIMERSEEEKLALPDQMATILFSIVTVGGGRPDNKEEALTWYNALSPRDVSYLHQKRGELTPQLDPELQIKCDKCESLFVHTLDLHRDFFRRS